jgi:MarR family transcriptional regulator, temperature-dependent positive regulator of motility
MSIESSDLATHPGHLTRRLQQIAYQLWNVQVSHEITPPQFTVLTCLAARPDIDQKTLGDLASLDRSTVADVVARLVQRGMIRRLRDPRDARRNLLRLSTRGTRTQEELDPRVQEMNLALLGPLTAAERAEFMRLLAKLVGPEPVGPGTDKDNHHPLT